MKGFGAGSLSAPRRRKLSVFAAQMRHCGPSIFDVNPLKVGLPATTFSMQIRLPPLCYRESLLAPAMIEPLRDPMHSRLSYLAAWPLQSD